MKTLWIGFLWPVLSGASAGALQITIRLVNTEVIAGNVRGDGLRTAAKILRTAGVELIWMDCGPTIPSPCGKNLEPGEFWLQVVAGRPPRSSPDAAGFAVLYPTTWGRDGYAGVFYRKVLEIASREECDPGSALGVTIAHEIGHILLVSNAHSSNGVMRARLQHEEFGRASRGDLRFTPEQVETIRRSWGCDNSPSGCRIPKS